MPAYGPGRSNYTPETGGPTARIADLWSVSTDASLSGPILADETLFVGGDDGDVRAFDARTGAERWRESVGAPAGTPGAMDGLLYVPTADAVVALDAHDGSPRWRVDTPGRVGFLLARHGVYYVSGRDSPSVVSLDRTDGSERWRADVREPWTPTLFAGGGRVFVSTGSYAPRPWVFAADTGEFRGDRRPVRGADFAGERFCVDGTIVAGDGFFGNVRADTVGPDGYASLWRTGVDTYGRFALGGGADRLFLSGNAGDAPGLYALSLADGRRKWYTDAVSSVIGRPVVAEDVVVVSTGAELRCFDSDDGAELWTHPGDGIGKRFILADDLVFTTRANTVRALRARR